MDVSIDHMDGCMDTVIGWMIDIVDGWMNKWMMDI